MSLFVPCLTALARRLALAGALAAGLVTAAHATTFTEVADAGETVGTSQVTTGAAGSLTDIFGSISSSTNADLFVINITNVAAFSASTVNAASAALDTQLFLFKLDGTPVYTNDDANGFSFQSALPAGSSLGPTTTGQYILGIAISGYLAVNSVNQQLFAQGSGLDVLGPNSGLNPARLGGFFDSTYDVESGAYDIQLTGASVASVTAVPEPSTYALMLLGGGVLAFAAPRRRRAAPARA